MELKRGYKQTEVGVIPEDWDVLPLGGMVDQSRSIRYGIVQPGKHDHQGRFMIRGQDYSRGWVDASELFRVGAAIEERYRNARVKSGDLIITIVGAGTGHIEAVPDWLNGANLTQTTARIAIDPAKADSGFCRAILQSRLGKSQVAGYVKGAAQPGLNCGDVERFLLPLPRSRHEQRAIAAALGDVDALLGALEKLIAKKRDLKQAAMQQLLTGKTRLPGFSGAWETAPFGRVLARVNAKEHQIQTSEYQTTGAFPVVDQGKEPVIGFSDREDKRFHCPEGGVIVFGDHTCVVKFAHFDFVVGADGTQILAAKPGHSARFHAYQLQLAGIQSTGYNRHFRFVRERAFAAPRLPEQAAIAAVISDMDGEIAAVEARLGKTRVLKQGMMQELLTGRIRLPVPA